ncbi:MAG: tetratricopeptide repeat protein [Sandaracinaceae bacterium]
MAAGLPVLATTAPASAWDPFLVENDHVNDGNARLTEGNTAAALHHYDLAARELPNAPGVQLNRGLALLEAGELPSAREAFLAAAEPPAPTEMRADAYYDLGLAFYREGDAAAEAENTEEATGHFRDAADAFRRSLRLRPGNADAGWNLELALRRIREQEERQEQEEQEQEDQEQEQDDQEQDEDGEPEDQDGESEDQEGEDQEGEDQEGEPEEQDGEDQEGEPEEQDGEDQEGEDEEQSGDQDGSEDPQDGEGEENEPQEGEGDESALPPDHRRVLDALRDGEENLERHRARSRATRENRRVEQDW